MLRDVAPLLASDDMTNLLFGQAVPNGKASTAMSTFVQDANVLDLARVQLVVAAVSAFASGVAVVICERAEEEMRRIHARRVVAMVTHAQTWWNWTVGVFKRHSMSAPALIVLWPWSSKAGEAAIASGDTTADPLPTIIRATFSNLLPEALALVGAFWHRSLILPLRFV